MSSKITLVIGASENPERYSYKAITQLLKKNHSVIALSNKAGNIQDVNFITELKHFKKINTVTLYVGPKNQEKYYDYIISLNPGRVIFNPGTENEAFYALLETANIPYQESCTLVMLSIGVY
jgi:uncharacterized protein